MSLGLMLKFRIQEGADTVPRCTPHRSASYVVSSVAEYVDCRNGYLWAFQIADCDIRLCRTTMLCCGTAYR